MNNNYHTLIDVINVWQQGDPGKDALVLLTPDGAEQRVTYSQLYRDAVNAAGELQALGAQPREVILLLFAHSYQLLTAFFGAISLGATSSILPYLKTQTPCAADLAHARQIAAFVQPKAVITPPNARVHVSAAFAETGCPVWSIPAISAEHDVNDLVAPMRLPQPEDPAYLQFSSGTTGAQKGVILSHRAILNNLHDTAEFYHYQPDDVTVSWLPLYHDMGLFPSLLLPLLMAGPLSSTPSVPRKRGKSIRFPPLAGGTKGGAQVVPART